MTWVARVVLGAALLVCAPSFGAPYSLIGKPAPDFALKALDGKNLRLSEFRGQVVLINFWARWAGVSLQEMPALNQIHGTYQRAGVVVLGVSIDEDYTRAREFASSAHVVYPMLFDTGDATGTNYAIDKLPLTLLIDRDGIVRFANSGYKRGDEKVYIEQIRELLRDGITE